MTLLNEVLSTTDLFDANAAVGSYPWIIEDNHDCVISPDCDGLLCGLFLSHFQGWHIRGFYDTKALVLDHCVDPKKCIYADVEIFRENVRSFGNHMVLFNANHKPPTFDAQFNSCFSINNWRGHDRRVFRRKYPFASIHALLAVAATRHKITLPISAAVPLLHADGAYKLLLQYTENTWDWLRYLTVNNPENPLHSVFHNPDLTVFQLMEQMLSFWHNRDEISETGQRGDRITITERGGEGRVMNLTEYDSKGIKLFRLEDGMLSRGERFLEILSDLTGWTYNPSHWTWFDWSLFEFDKGVEEDMGRIATFNNMVAKNPLSWAITGGTTCQYTTESNSTKSPFG